MTSPAVPAPRRRLELLAGATVALLVCLGVPWLAHAVGTRFALTPAVPAALVLLAGLVLRREPRTRAWGNGLLAGLGAAAVLAILGLIVLVRVFAG